MHIYVDFSNEIIVFPLYTSHRDVHLANSPNDKPSDVRSQSQCLIGNMDEFLFGYVSDIS